MSLSNIDKDHMHDLFLSLKIDDNKLDILKYNSAQYAKLKSVIQQMEMLKIQAKNIIEEAKSQNELHNVKVNFKLVSGKTYYLYESKQGKYFSLIAPMEWDHSGKFIGKYFYDYDKQFIEL